MGKFKQLKRKIPNVIFLIIIFHTGLLISVKSISNFLNEPNFIAYFGWVYGALYIYLIYILIKRLNFRFSINYSKLIFIEIAIALIFVLFANRLNIGSVLNIQHDLYQYVTIDDEQYFEDPYADDDPIWGRDESGYSSTFKYFCPIGTKLIGLKLPIGTIDAYSDSSFFLTDKYEEEIPINISYTIFWQYAIIQGFEPLNKENYNTKGFLNRIFLIAPLFIVETILNGFERIIVLLVIVLIITVLYPSFLIEERDYYSLGVEKLNKNDNYSAIEYFNNAIKIEPKNDLLYFKRGLAKLNGKKYADAIEDFTKALIINNKDASYFFNRGLARYSLKQFENSLKDFNDAIILNPNESTFYYNRGKVKYDMKDYNSSIQDHNEAIRIDPNYVFAYWNRGNCKDCLGDHNAAYEDFKKVIELNSGYSSAFYNCGRQCYFLKDYKNAINYFSKAIDLNSSDYIYFYYRALSKYYLTDNLGSMLDYNKAIELNPEDSNSYINRSQVRFYLNDITGSIEDFNLAKKLNPKIALPYFLEPFKERIHKKDILKISSTITTPEVTLDPSGIIKFTGYSIPCDSFQFFTPIEEWVKNYVNTPSDTTSFEIQLEKINADSCKYLVHIIRIVSYVTLKNKKFIINWYYVDSDIFETGKTISSILDLPFNFIKIS